MKYIFIILLSFGVVSISYGQEAADSLLLRTVVTEQAGEIEPPETDEFSDMVMPGAYGDLFSQATDFSFSFLRYRPRGYQRRYGELRWNGVLIEDWWSGGAAWGAVGSMTSSSGYRSSLHSTDYSYRTAGIGSLAGVDIVDSRSTHKRQGGRVALSRSNRTYTNRVTAAYSLGAERRGWSFSAELSRRWGESLSIEGVFADSWNFLGSVSKRLSDSHTVELTILAAPSQRATQRASTQEAYALTDNNLYNPNWGMQGDRIRASRVRVNIQPLAMLEHRWTPDQNTTLTNSVMAMVGSDSYSTINWQSAPNPNPDYYRYMPSYQSTPEASAEVARLWREDISVRQIDYQALYDINHYNTPRANYIIEQRVRRTWQAKLQSSLWMVRGQTTLSTGVELTTGRNRSFKELEDLLGGEYWLDTDQFVENDDDVKDKTQNDLRNPNRHIGVGDRFGYDYAVSIARAAAWFSLSQRVGSWRFSGAASLSGVGYRRIGYYEKENFAGGLSYGKSDMTTHVDYMVKASAEYNRGARLRAALNLTAGSFSPTPSQLFIWPSYRNAVVENPQNESLLSAEVVLDYRAPALRLRGAIYATSFSNAMRTLNFYDDLEHLYCNYIVKGINTRHLGIELAADIKLTDMLNLSLVGIWSNNRYTSNPEATEYKESTGAEVRHERVLYESLHVAGSPELLGLVSLKFNTRGWIANLSMSGWTGGFVDVAPLRRTERALDLAHNRDDMMEQEQLTGGFSLDLFAGKSIYLRHAGLLGIYIGANNLTNNRNIISSGYESSRLLKAVDGLYSAQHTRYYYSLGVNFFVNVSYRF